MTTNESTDPEASIETKIEQLSTERETDDDNSIQTDTKEEKSGELTVLNFIIILAGIFTSAQVVAVPWAFAQLGYIGGPLCLILWIAIAYYFNCFLIDVAIQEKCKNFGDVGFHLMGRPGRIMFVLFQTFNNLFWMPVVFEYVGLSLQYLFHYPLGDCVGYWKIIAFAVLFIEQQLVKTWGHVAFITYFTFTAALINAYFLLPYAFVQYQEEVQTSPDYMGATLAFGNPENTWHGIGVAVSSIASAFAPVFLLVELLGDIKLENHTCAKSTAATWKKALGVVALIIASFYLVSSMTCILLWGWNVADPVTLDIPNDSWIGVLLTVIILALLLIDYIVAAKLTNDNIMGYLAPTEWNDGNHIHHFMLSLPTAVFALLMTLFIPNFPTLIAFVASITVFGTTVWGPCLAWFVGGKEKYERRTWPMATGLVFGVAITLWTVAAVLYQAFTADFTSGHFFCTST